MTKTRPSYTAEFKQEAASLVLDKGYGNPEACSAMGVGNTAMRRWVKQLNAERGGVTPTAKAMTADQQKTQSFEITIKK